MSVALGELAVQFGCELRGDPSLRIEGVAPLSQARPGTLSFLANPRYRAQLAQTRAAVVVLDAASAERCPVAVLIAANPHATYARIAALLYPRPLAPAGVHPSAVVAEGAQIDASAYVGPLVVIGAGARVGARAMIGPHSLLADGAVIGADTQLVARVTIERGVRIGARVLVHPGAVIGADGFGFAREDARWLKVPQLGGVHIGDDVEIGANTTIDRGAIDDTVVEEGVKLDNQIQIGHNVYIGAHTAIAACTGISGSVQIGKRCMIAGAVGISGHISICDDVIITGMAMVTRSIAQPGIYSSGFPAEPARRWRHMVARFRMLVRREVHAGDAPIQTTGEDDSDD